MIVKINNNDDNSKDNNIHDDSKDNNFDNDSKDDNNDIIPDTLLYMSLCDDVPSYILSKLYTLMSDVARLDVNSGTISFRFY